VIWVDTEDKFENVIGMADAFKRADFPATFFVVSNLFTQFPEMVRHMTPQMEIGSHSEDHKTFYLQSLAEQFDRIQTSRHEIEGIARMPVLGFRPPTEKYDVETVNAVLQNGMQYITGERIFPRFSPTWIASGKLAFFSRVLNDDISLRRSGLMDDPDDLIATVTRESAHVGKLNGLYLFGLHTQHFGKEEHRETLSRTLEVLSANRYWKSNFREVHQWMRDRLELDAELIAAAEPG
jgi:peptidoglycan/xylan/chitin deacetylase (PgdA/CDA1 family)